MNHRLEFGYTVPYIPLSLVRTLRIDGGRSEAHTRDETVGTGDMIKDE